MNRSQHAGSGGHAFAASKLEKRWVAMTHDGKGTGDHWKPKSFGDDTAREIGR